MIDKSRKAVIRAAANKARKDGAMALTKLGDDVENPLSIMMGYKDRSMKAICQSEEEIQYFELCYLYRNEKAAKEFELWNEGFWSSFGSKSAYDA
ncbi:MAG: hypothetical protein SPL80_05230 [Bacilli bacterium]|nr:hypothetical protein [Bacilli bacterium]